MDSGLVKLVVMINIFFNNQQHKIKITRFIYIKVDFHLEKWLAISQPNRDKTMFNFHMNSFDAIIENKADVFIIKRKDITFKNATKSNYKSDINKICLKTWNVPHQRK